MTVERKRGWGEVNYKRHHFALQVSFDLSLARGLDYYTGVIYEALLTGKAGVRKMQALP